MLPTASATGLLTFRLSPDNFKAYVAESRKSRQGYRGHALAEIDPAKIQSVVVRGFDPDAVAAIKAANDGKGDALQATYDLGKQMLTVIWQVEDILRVPSEHWRLTTKTHLCGISDALTDTLFEVKVQAKPLELLLISQFALPRYLAQHEFISDWKRLQPAPPPPSNEVDSLARAQTTWHLLSPVQDEHWLRYFAQRRDAEWNMALMYQRESLSLTVSPFLDKIKDGVDAVLQRTNLNKDEQAVVADGILPQALEVWDDGSDGVYLEDVTAFTHVSSPVRPANLEVFVHYPSPCNIRILYRLNDPAPAPSSSGPGAQTFHVRKRNTYPQRGVDGWRLLFEMDVKRRTWGLTSADALLVHDALFGTAEAAESVGAKVSVLDAILLVLAAVGFHMELRKGSADEAAQVWDEDRLAYGDGPNWKLDKLEWVGKNLRTACGVPR